MTRFALFGTLVVAAAFSAIASSPARAFCVGEDASLTVEQDATDDESFVRSSPASADSELRLEVDLDDLTGSSDADADEASAMELDDSPSESTTSTTADLPDVTPASVDDLETAPDSSAEALGDVELETPSAMSREEYLDDAEERLNQCL